MMDVVDVSRQSLITIVILAGPALVVSVLVAVLVGFLQTVTQIQDHVISFVAKLLAVVTTLACLAPWFLERLNEYATELFTQQLGY